MKERSAALLSKLWQLYPIALVALVWELTARLGLVRPLFLPPLSSVLAKLPQMAVAGELFTPLVVSLYRAAAGFALAMAVGVTLGFLMARVRWVRWLLDPLVAVSFPSPKVAFLPIFILWFGIDHLSKIALVTITCVFPFIIAARAGAGTVPRTQLWAARAMGTSNAAILWLIVLPASLPSLMSGVRIAVPYALVSTFAAEMIAGGGGLGGDLVYAQRYFETVTVFAILLIMLAAGYVIDEGVLRFRKRVLRWHEG
jgi:ABC-type nitrate/sulfonate/bicarbonate transport system permease component